MAHVPRRFIDALADMYGACRPEEGFSVEGVRDSPFRPDLWGVFLSALNRTGSGFP